MLFQCWSSAVGGGPILKQHQVKTLCLLGSTQVFVYTQPSPSIIFSPADHGTFSKTAGQSQAYYNTWNWEWGTYDVIHLQILTCEVAVSTAGSVAYHLTTPMSCPSHTGLFWVKERYGRHLRSVRQGTESNCIGPRTPPADRPSSYFLTFLKTWYGSRGLPNRI